MRSPVARVAVASLLALTFCTAPARADEPTAEDLWNSLSGEIRAGWRFLDDEGEGRFFQDRSLQDGPRIFDFELRGDDARETAPLTFLEATAHGVGDEESDYRLRLARDRTWRLDGGYSRDDFSYRATGDPFPYDTIRERSDLRLRWTPSTRLTLRLDWDRSLRRGDSYLAADTNIRDEPPATVDSDIVQDHRPLRQQSDRVTLGVDAAFDGGFRFSLAESVRLAQVDDTRLYRIPRALSGTTPVFEALRREQRSPAWTTTAKAGWTSPGGSVDVSAVLAYTIEQSDTRLAGSAQGFEVQADADGMAPRGEFRQTTRGANELDRDLVDGRLETLWRPHDDWEFTAAVERETVVDDASLFLLRHRTFSRTSPAPVPDETITTSFARRIVNRLERASLDAQWQVRDNLRLRLGEEYLRENLRVPTDSRAPEPFPTNFSSTSWRATAGADWSPVERVDLSLLVRRGTNDDPHTATSFETSDEISWRGRWKASEALAVTTVYRHKGFRQDTQLDSASRSESGSLGVTWTAGGLAVTPNVTYQDVRTRTDTRFVDRTISVRPQQHQVSFDTRDTIASLDVRYAFTTSLRGFATATWIDARGDYQAQWDEASLGAELDLRKDLSVGAALRSWRLDERRRHVDDYDVVGAEVWVTFRF